MSACLGVFIARNGNNAERGFEFGARQGLKKTVQPSGYAATARLYKAIATYKTKGITSLIYDSLACVLTFFVLPTQYSPIFCFFAFAVLLCFVSLRRIIALISSLRPSRLHRLRPLGSSYRQSSLPWQRGSRLPPVFHTGVATARKACHLRASLLAWHTSEQGTALL